MEKKFGSSRKTSVSSSFQAIQHNQNLKPQLAVALILVLVVGAVVYFQGGKSTEDQITLAADNESVSTISQESITTQAATSTALNVNPLAQPSDTLVEATTTLDEEITSSDAAKQKPVGYPPSPKRTQCQSYYGSSVANVAFAPATTADNEETTTTKAETTTTEPPTTKAPTTKPPTTKAPTTKPPTTKAPTTKPPTTKAPTTETPTTATPTTAKPATTNPHPSGWVNAGHNVYVPKVLIVIRCCESTGNYTAANAHSSARGAYQFLTGSWAHYGHKDRYGASQAHLASPAQQDEAALKTWERDGTRPWNASKACWGQNPV